VAARLLLDRSQLRAVVARLGEEISVAYDPATSGSANGDVILIGLLRGSVVFLADLVRALRIDCAVDFLAVSAYARGSGRIRLLKDLDLDIAGRDVVLVEDVVDTGLTLAYLVGELRQRGPASVEVCALIDKQSRRIVPVPLRFVGATVDEPFVLGYGLDMAGRYRNLELIAAAPFEAVRADPDMLVDELYPAPPEREASAVTGQPTPG
jgi:hypoxanthine phosphoribosyltransferase